MILVRTTRFHRERQQKKKITLLNKEKRKRLFEKKQHLDSKARHLTTELSTIAQRGRVRKWFERLIE
jgi:hypothetical protein